MKKVTFAALLVACAALSPGQDPVSEARMREFLLQQFERRQEPAASEAAARRDAQYRERQFVETANRFVELWRRFARDYNERKALNIKVVREMSKAFRDLENSEDWPKSRR